MHIYAFGSVCRGEVSPNSDIDLLAITDGFDPRFNARDYSIYSYDRIRELWREGNPFAWHLSLESALVYAADGADVLRRLGAVAAYRRCSQDCEKFLALYEDAQQALSFERKTAVFDMATMFLAMRNIGTCFSLGVLNRPVFSRDAARRLGSDSLQIDDTVFATYEAARLLSTRGAGTPISDRRLEYALEHADKIRDWMQQLVRMAHATRVQ